MLSQIINAARRSQDTLVADAFGMTAIMVLLVVGLHLPALT